MCIFNNQEHCDYRHTLRGAERVLTSTNIHACPRQWGIQFSRLWLYLWTKNDWQNTSRGVGGTIDKQWVHMWDTHTLPIPHNYPIVSTIIKRVGTLTVAIESHYSQGNCPQQLFYGLNTHSGVCTHKYTHTSPHCMAMHSSSVNNVLLIPLLWCLSCTPHHMTSYSVVVKSALSVRPRICTCTVHQLRSTVTCTHLQQTP